jgi:uncharacterized protein
MTAAPITSPATPENQGSFIQRFGWLYAVIGLIIVLSAVMVFYTGWESIITPLGFIVGLAILRFFPRKLPAGNPLAYVPRAVIAGELRPILGYALLYPLLLIPVVIWGKLDLISLFPQWTTDWVFSLNYAIVGKIALLAVPALVLAIRYGGGARRLGLAGITQPWRWIGAGIGALMLIGLPVLGLLGIFIGGTVRAVPAWLIVALFAIAFFGAGFPEEFFYRILLQTRLEAVLGRWNGLAVTSVLFGLLHFPSRLAFIYLGATGSIPGDALLTLAAVITGQGVAGIFLGYLWLRYRNAWLNMAAHTLYDGLIFVATVIAMVKVG